MSEQEGRAWRREEVRGIFTLGLMAILVALRVGQPTINLASEGETVAVVGIIDLTLVFWGIYAFSMIISLSTDIFPEKACKISYKIGILFLLASFLLYYLVAMGFASKLPYFWRLGAFLLLIAPILYVTFRLIIRCFRLIVKKEKA